MWLKEHSDVLKADDVIIYDAACNERLKDLINEAVKDGKFKKAIPAHFVGINGTDFMYMYDGKILSVPIKWKLKRDIYDIIDDNLCYEDDECPDGPSRDDILDDLDPAIEQIIDVIEPLIKRIVELENQVTTLEEAGKPTGFYE